VPQLDWLRALAIEHLNLLRLMGRIEPPMSSKHPPALARPGPRIEMDGFASRIRPIRARSTHSLGGIPVMMSYLSELGFLTPAAKLLANPGRRLIAARLRK
jgi:hypothetical protein